MSGFELIEVDPRKLRPHPHHVRTTTDAPDDLVASVKERGILQPPVVSAVEGKAGEYQIHFGHRRTAAAVKAKLQKIPVFRIPADGVAGDLVDMLTENVHRRELSVAEEAAVYEQLAAEGWDVPTIAKAAARDKATVEAGLKIAGASQAKEALAKLPATVELTLTQAAAFADFDDDPDALARLTNIIDNEPEYFDHDVAELRAERATRESEAAAMADLAKAGVRVLDPEDRPAYGSTLTPGESIRIEDLLGSTKGSQMSVADHESCPGHCAFVAAQWIDGEHKHAPVWCCSDPVANGHQSRFGTAPAAAKGDNRTDAQREKDRLERRAVIDNNKAWKVATPVRIAFVKDLLKRRTAPKGMLRVCVELIGDNAHMAHAGTYEMLKTLTGLEGGPGSPYSEGPAGAAGKMARKGTDAQLPLALFALVAAACESHFAQANRPYETKSPKHQAYLQVLVDAGYTLAHVEELILPKAKKRTATKTAPTRKAAAKKATANGAKAAAR